MPIEPSPIPFADQQIPYSPKFIPGQGEAEIAPNGTIIGGGVGGGGSIAGLTHGPATVAASAIIPPSSGGIAGPHRAIAALPDAGYTAPTLRAASLTGDYPPIIGPSGGGLQSGSYEGYPAPASIYAGGSLYYTHPPDLQPCPTHGDGDRSHRPAHSVFGGGVTDVYQEGWSASLPAPRQAPIAPLVLQQGHSAHRHYSQYHEDRHHQDERGRQLGREIRSGHSPNSARHHGHSHHLDSARNWDDGASDASYYAMPRRNRQRSSSQGSSGSDFSSLPSEHESPGGGRDGGRKEGLHRQTLNQNHDRSPGMNPQDTITHAPISPSPLPKGRHVERSPYFPLRERQHAMDDTNRARNVSTLGPGRRDSLWLGLNGLSINGDDQSGRPGLARRGSSGEHSHERARRKSHLLAVQGSVSDSEVTRIRRSSVRNRSRRGASPSSKGDSDSCSEDEGENRKDRDGRREGTTRRWASIRYAPPKHRGRDRDRDEPSPYHKPAIPIDPPPLPDYTSDIDRQSSDVHRRHRPSSHNSRAYQGQQPRRRTLSEQDHLRYQDDSNSRRHQHHSHHQDHQHQAPILPAHAGTVYPNQSASVIGDPPGMRGGRQPFPLSAGIGEYPMTLRHEMDEHVAAIGVAASVAGTALTFMDGPMAGRPMAGRVSQYGLPKYAHNPKVDYRRFCVQRGNADVFLD